MTEQFRAHLETPKQNSPEAGARPLGIPPPPGPEQTPQGGGIKSAERQPLPSVWDYLERFTRLNAPDVEDRPRWGSQEYKHEADKLNRLEKELDEKGTDRDKLIRDLYTEITSEPAPLPVPVDFRELLFEEFFQFRSKVEPLSNEEIREEIRRAKVEFDRKAEAILGHRYTNPDDLPGLARI